MELGLLINEADEDEGKLTEQGLRYSNHRSLISTIKKTKF